MSVPGSARMATVWRGRRYSTASLPRGAGVYPMSMLLHVADLHGSEYGLVTEPGTLHCIEPDGLLRSDLDSVNRYL